MDESLTGLPGGVHDRAVLGGWRVRTEGVPEGRTLIKIDTPEHGAGDRVRVVIEFDTTLIHGSPINNLIQDALDGWTAEHFDFTDDPLVTISSPRTSEKRNPTAEFAEKSEDFWGARCGTEFEASGETYRCEADGQDGFEPSQPHLHFASDHWRRTMVYEGDKKQCYEGGERGICRLAGGHEGDHSYFGPRKPPFS